MLRVLSLQARAVVSISRAVLLGLPAPRSCLCVFASQVLDYGLHYGLQGGQQVWLSGQGGRGYFGVERKYRYEVAVGGFASFVQSAHGDRAARVRAFSCYVRTC